MSSIGRDILELSSHMEHMSGHIHGWISGEAESENILILLIGFNFKKCILSHFLKRTELGMSIKDLVSRG